MSEAPIIKSGLETGDDLPDLPPAHKYQVIYTIPTENKRRRMVMVSDPETLENDVRKKLKKLTKNSYKIIEIQLKLWEVDFAEYVATCILEGKKQIYNTKYEDLMFDFAHQMNGVFMRTKQAQLRAVADMDGAKVVVYRRVEL